MFGNFPIRAAQWVLYHTSAQSLVP